MTQTELRAARLVAFWREVVESKSPLSAYAIGKRLGYRPTHAHRWTAPLIREGLVERRATGLVRSRRPMTEREVGERLARAAARSLKGRRTVRWSDTVKAQDTVGRLLGVRLYDSPMTAFD